MLATVIGTWRPCLCLAPRASQSYIVPLSCWGGGVRGWLGGGVCQLAKVNLPPPLMELKRDDYAMKLGVQCISYNKVSFAILTSWRYSFIKEWTDGTNEKCFKFNIAGHAKYLSYMNLYFLTAYFSMLCTHQINECHKYPCCSCMTYFK